MSIYYQTYQRMNVSIGDSNYTVVKKALKRVNRKSRYSRKTRKIRHSFLRDILSIHQKEKLIYQHVVGGGY